MEIRKWRVYVANLNPRIGTEPEKVRPLNLRILLT